MADAAWGLRFLALLLVAGALSVGVAWVDAFYRGISVNGTLSFPAFDYPWMPVHTSQVAIIGNHYFGDFQLPDAWAANVRGSLSPYLNSAVPANYPPLAIAALIPFTFIPIRPATVLFLGLSVVVFLVPLWLLLSPMRYAMRCVVLVPTAMVSSAMISLLDRGNDIGIALGLIAWALWAWRTERWVWCGTLLAAAIAYKAYPVVLLVIPLALRRYRFSFAVLFAAVSTNLVALAFFPGGFIENLKVVIPAMTSQRLTTGTQLTSWSLYSLVPKVAGLLLGPTHVASLSNPGRLVIWIPSVVYLLLVFIIIRRRAVPEWCWGALALASLQLVVPLSGVYTTGWACLAAIWYIQGSLAHAAPNAVRAGDNAEQSVLLRVLVMLALLASIVPSAFTIGGANGFDVVATRLLSPAFLFLTLCVALVRSAHARPSDGQASSPPARRLAFAPLLRRLLERSERNPLAP